MVITILPNRHGRCVWLKSRSTTGPLPGPFTFVDHSRPSAVSDEPLRHQVSNGSLECLRGPPPSLGPLCRRGVGGPTLEEVLSLLTERDTGVTEDCVSTRTSHKQPVLISVRRTERRSQPRLSSLGCLTPTTPDLDVPPSSVPDCVCGVRGTRVGRRGGRWRGR